MPARGHDSEEFASKLGEALGSEPPAPASASTHVVGSTHIVGEHAKDEPVDEMRNYVRVVSALP